MNTVRHTFSGRVTWSPIAITWAVALLGALTVGSGALLADDVHLTNGSVFEDVVTRTTQTHVIIEMAIGKLTLPLSQVKELVVADTPIAEFQRRHKALLEDPRSGAENWLQLSRWGLAHGLSAQAGQAALFAARLDAGLDGLEPLLTGLGYERVESVGWIARSDAMRLRGMVLYDGEWMSPNDRAARIASDRPARTRNGAGQSRAQGTQDPRSVGDNEVALASIKLAEKALEQGRQADREARQTERRAQRDYGFGANRFGVYPGVILPRQRFASPEEAAAYSERVRKDIAALANRSPGSIIPLNNSGPQRSGVFSTPQP